MNRHTLWSHPRTTTTTVLTKSESMVEVVVEVNRSEAPQMPVAPKTISYRLTRRSSLNAALDFLEAMGPANKYDARAARKQRIEIAACSP